MKESPFAPLEAWLRESLDDAQLVLAIESPDLDDPRPALEAYDVGDHHLDLRHGPTRYAVLRALHDVGIDRPWALGAPWSPLTDEQAGRATAAILRAVKADPSKPVGVVPLMILGEWEQPTNNSAGRSIVLTLDREYGGDEPAWPLMVTARGWLVQGGPAKANVDFDRFDILAHGPETGEPGRIAADSAARALGCLMIEDIMP